VSAKKPVVAPKAEKPEPVPEPVFAPEPAPAVEAAPRTIADLAPAAAELAAQETASAPVEEPATPVAPVVQAVAEPAIEEPRIMTTIDKAQAFFTDFNDRAKTAVEKSTKAVEELNDFAKGNVEALVESSKIAAKGIETLGQDAAEYSRKSFEAATAALKSLSAVKSPTEFFKLQSDYVRTAFDSYVAEASKNTEAMLKLAGDASQPISNRFAAAAEKVKAVAA
jgi:phasin family protein